MTAVGAAPAPEISGRVIALCGEDVYSQDVYEIRRGTITRRTTTEPGNGVHSFAVGNGQIALSRSRDAIDHVELGSLDAPTYFGRVLGPGTAPALDDDGTLAWTLVTERVGHYADAVYVKRPGKVARRVATYPHAWQIHFVDGRLRAVASRRGKFAEVRGVGTKHVVRIPLIMRSARHVVWSRSGRLAYGDGHNRLRINSAGGRRVASYATEWVPLAWSPDERKLLVTNATRKPAVIGLMYSKTGSVRALGALSCGPVVSANWLPD